MREFFVGQGTRLELFGFVHILCILFVIVGIILIYKNKNKISKISEEKKRFITIILISIMFLNMTIYYLSKIIYGTYNIKTNLPLHFCFIAGYIFMIAWLFKTDKLIKFSYFGAFIGPLVAIIWPDVNNQTSFVFYQFFISHHIFLLGNLFLYCAYHYEITKKDAIYTFVNCNILFALVSIINYYLDSNYIMSKSLPNYFLEMYPIFKKINNPIFLLMISCIIVIIIAYIFSKLYKIKEKSRSSSKKTLH